MSVWTQAPVLVVLFLAVASATTVLLRRRHRRWAVLVPPIAAVMAVSIGLLGPPDLLKDAHVVAAPTLMSPTVQTASEDRERAIRDLQSALHGRDDALRVARQKLETLKATNRELDRARVAELDRLRAGLVTEYRELAEEARRLGQHLRMQAERARDTSEVLVEASDRVGTFPPEKVKSYSGGDEKAAKSAKEAESALAKTLPEQPYADVRKMSGGAGTAKYIGHLSGMKQLAQDLATDAEAQEARARALLDEAARLESELDSRPPTR
ncbi:MAG TPA: hypothetical protein VMK12_13120 [Anaeromyxobacteraceae bacterium]|nr:hypothetical protein [Anaeromyxobacteraceae bacterium]